MSFTMKLRKPSTKRKSFPILNKGKSWKRHKARITTPKCKKCNNGMGDSASVHFPNIWEELRSKNQLCDGTVKCDDGTEFNVHRIILSAISPYFRALFTNSINRGGQEIKEANVNISSGAFRIVLDYAYTGNCIITTSNVFEVLKYADQYGILNLVHKCCEFLINDLSPTNCLQILKFSNQFFCKYLTNKGNIYLLQNFTEVFNNNEYFCELPAKQLKQILSDDYLNVKTEVTVFEAIKTWIQHFPDTKKSHLLDLIKCIRMGNLSLEKILKIARWPMIQEDTMCNIYIADVLTILHDIRDVEVEPLNTYLTRPRIPYDVIFVIGGWTAGSPTSFVETYDNRSEKWLISSDTDVVARAYHGMCAYQDKIYLVGGFDGNEYFNTVRCFNPATHEWSDCACMYYSRCYVSVVLCMGKIYAMGGYNGRIRMNSVERYDPVKNQWELVSSMLKQRSDASAATLNDKIYIVGGFNGQEVINSAEMYDPLTNQWSYISSMISARSGVSLIAFQNSLYAIGGFNGYTRLPTSEKFVPDASSSSSWMEIPEMMTPRSNFGTVILDGYIYVIGGFNGSTTINYVECYDAELGEWLVGTSMNLNRSALSACVISGLPNSRDYSFLDRSQKERGEHKEKIEF